MRRHFNNDKHVCWVVQITTVTTVVVTYTLQESQLVMFCFLWCEWGGEGKGRCELGKVKKGPVIFFFHSILLLALSNLLSCLDLFENKHHREAEGSRAHYNSTSRWYRPGGSCSQMTRQPVSSNPRALGRFHGSQRQILMWALISVRNITCLFSTYTQKRPFSML